MLPDNLLAADSSLEPSYPPSHNMKFSILASAVAAAASFGLATAQEAARFGIVNVSPSVVKPGQVRTRFYHSDPLIAHGSMFDIIGIHSPLQLHLGSPPPQVL